MPFSPEQSALLAAKLDRSNVKERKMAGRTMSYVEGWHVIAEANRIFGFDGWTSETVLLQETNRELVTIEGDRGTYKQWRIGYIAKVRITAGGVSREGTGYGSGMGKPEAVGDAVEGAIKESETDARKRALMTFGSPFGLALYDKDQSEVQDGNAASKLPKPAVAPSKQPGGELYAPERVTVPEKPAVTLPTQQEKEAREWGVWAIGKIPEMTKAKLDQFEANNKANLQALKDLDPKTFKLVGIAIANRIEELFA